ncbi:MAG TPA: S-layer homology domain-containing protein, partial [Mycobacteriales bacterium]|nr:S-layer homology domain-containing protein [Mycobacteriales bacterium]
ATGPDVRAEGGSALLSSPRLPDDGEHRLRAVAVDPAGNRSTQTDLAAPGPDGSPSTVTYVLDSRVPALAFGVVLDDDFVEARFTQPVSGPNSPADWRVVDAAGRPVPFGSGSVTVVKVDGDGDRRRIQAAGARVGDLLVYAPQGGRYANAAGAEVGDGRVPLLALAPPVVTTPPRAVFVRETSAAVGGTADPGTTVQVLRRGAGGQPAGAPVVTAAVAEDGTWSTRVPLRTDEAHDLLVRVLRPDGRTSVAVPVPTITQDAVAPVLSADGLPGSGAVLQGGSLFEFRWTASDRNLGLRPIVLEHSVDGGRTFERLELEPVESANDPAATNRRTVRLPSTSTDSAVLRITATDLAGNSSAVASRTFTQTGVRDVRRFACPPDRVQPAGFVDTAESTFRFEIDCLAAYGFTRGVTPDRYVPLGDVTRAQMAVFVARLARYGGLELDTRDRGFTDLGASPQETRDAVNGLAALGVVEGTGGGRYEPAGRVTRAQMASFLARLQRSVGTAFPAGRDAFDDDARDVHEANINAVAAAGVVQGTTFRTYQPRASITRQQMAGFLVRYVDGRIEAGEMPSRF